LNYTRSDSVQSLLFSRFIVARSNRGRVGICLLG